MLYCMSDTSLQEKWCNEEGRDATCTGDASIVRQPKILKKSVYTSLRPEIKLKQQHLKCISQKYHDACCWRTLLCQQTDHPVAQHGCPLKVNMVEPGQYQEMSGENMLWLEVVLVRPVGGPHPVVCYPFSTKKELVRNWCWFNVGWRRLLV